MEHSKAQALQKQIAELDRKVKEQHKLLNSSLLVFQDLDNKIETIVDALVASGLARESFEDAVDSRRGLRLLTTDEAIQNGDIAWVEYTAFMGEDQIAEDAMPIRVGSGAVNFEKAIVGHKVGEAVEYDHVINEEGEHKGKPVKFKIKITKAKTKTQNGVQLGTTDTRPVTGHSTDNDTESSPAGRGHEERHLDGDSAIQQGQSGFIAEGSGGGNAPSPETNGNG